MTVFLHIKSTFNALMELNQKPLGELRQNSHQTLDLEVQFLETIVLSAFPIHSASDTTRKLLPIISALKWQRSALNSSSPFVQITQYPNNHYEILLLENSLPSHTLPKVISQHSYSVKNASHTATLFFDGIYQFMIESPKEILLQHTVPHEIKSAKIEKIKNTDLLLLQADVENTCLYVLILAYQNGEYKFLLELVIDELEQVDSTLTTLSHVKDIAAHGIVREFVLQTNDLKEKEQYLVYTKEKPRLALVPAIVPYAFLEAIKVKNFTLARSYLTTELSDSCQDEHLEDYFGTFTEVVPPAYEEDSQNKVALIYENGIRQAKIFSVELRFNKISNFNEC